MTGRHEPSSLSARYTVDTGCLNVASFVGAVRGERNGAADPSGQEIVARMALLEQLRDAWKRAST